MHKQAYLDGYMQKEAIVLPKIIKPVGNKLKTIWRVLSGGNVREAMSHIDERKIGPSKAAVKNAWDILFENMRTAGEAGVPMNSALRKKLYQDVKTAKRGLDNMYKASPEVYKAKARTSTYRYRAGLGTAGGIAGIQHLTGNKTKDVQSDLSSTGKRLK